VPSMIAVAIPDKVIAVTCASPSSVLEVGALLAHYDDHPRAVTLLGRGNIQTLCEKAMDTVYQGPTNEEHAAVNYADYQQLISDSLSLEIDAVYILLQNGRWAVIELGEVGARSARLLNDVLAEKRRARFRVVK